MARAVLLVDAFADVLGGPDPRWVHVLAGQDEVSKPVRGERGEQVEDDVQVGAERRLRAVLLPRDRMRS